MRDLKIIDNDIKMTSLDVAEMTGKQHAHVTRDIENEMEQLKNAGINPLSIFGESTYTNERGKTYKCYQFGMEGALQLGARYSAETRHKMIQHIKKLEQKKQANTLPQTYNEAVYALADQLRINEQQTKQLEEQAPLIEEYNVFMNTMEEFEFKEVAKIISERLGIIIGRNRLTSFLRERKIIDNQNIAYQQYIDRGYFEIKTEVKFHRTFVVTFTTKKGLSYIYNLVQKYYKK